MNFLQIFMLLNTVTNIQHPVCRNCVHFIPSNIGSNKCGKFGEKDIVTGKLTFETARTCRAKDELCGIFGKHFEAEPHLRVRLFKEYISNIKFENVALSFVLVFFIFIGCHK